MQKINIHNYEAFLLDYLEGNLNENDLQELKTFAVLHSELEIDLSNNELPSVSDKKIIFENKLNLIKTEEDIYNEDLLNYVEGNLSENNKLSFELQIASNNQLQKELEAYKKTNLNITKENVAFNSKSLIKSEDDLILNNVALNYIENNLDTAEKVNFEKELKANLNLQKEVSLLQKTKLIADTSVIYPNKSALEKETKIIVLFNFRRITAIAASLLFLISLSFVLYRNYNTSTKIGTSLANNLKNKSTFFISKNKSQDSLNKNNTHTNSSQNLIANKTNPVIKNNHTYTTVVTHTVKLNNTNNPIANNSTNQKDSSSIISTNTNTAIAITSNTITTAVDFSDLKPVTLLAVEDDNDATNPTPETPQKNNFWKRAVKVANQLNGLGVKAVKGDEKNKNNYLLAFNSISVEKK